MAKIVKSPTPEVSKGRILIEQSTSTKIKAAIAKGATDQELRKIIEEGCSEMANIDLELSNQMRISLIQSCIYWQYEFKANMRMINKTAQIQINKQIEKYSQPGLTRVDETYVQDLNALSEQLKGNNTTPISFERFRGLDTERRAGLPIIKDYQRLVKQQYRLLASQQPKSNEVIDNKPRAVNLRNLAEMKARYEANMEDVAKLKEEGVALVWTSSHASCSPRCAEWQGRLFSLNGTSGTLPDGTKYTPLEEALNANGGNSIINGYNCRHYLIEWTPNSKPPKHYTEAEMKKEYAIDQVQRNFENSIRHMKEQEAVYRAAGMNEEADKLHRDWKLQEKDYQIYCLENKRSMQMWRTQVLDEEKENQPQEVIPPIEEKHYELSTEGVSEFTGGNKQFIKAFENIKATDNNSVKIVNNLNRLGIIDVENSKGRAGYIPGKNKVSVKKSDAEGTIYHETGHAIDHLLAKSKSSDDSFKWESEVLNDAIKATREKYKEGYSYVVPKEIIDNNNEAIEEIKTSINEWIKTDEAKKAVQKELDKYNYSNEAQRQRIINIATRKVIERRYRYECDHNETYNRSATLSDIFDAVCSGQVSTKNLNGYHGSGYYSGGFGLKYVGAGNGRKENTEIFANFVELKLGNYEKELNILKSSMPELYNELERLYERIGNELEQL